MRLPSPSQHSFARVPRATIERSSFDRSHCHKTTFDAGRLIPVWIDEGLPGDTFNMRMSAFARLATPLKPVMDNLYMDSFFFAVPIRLVWDNWPKFCGEQTNPGDSTDFVIPQTTSYTPLAGTLSDYFGIPVRGIAIQHSVLWHRAYHLIWNEWFRDQNMQNTIPFSTGDGPDANIGIVTPFRRGKRHDYFTSALPFPQKGESVLLPLGTTAPVIEDPLATSGPTFREVGALHGGVLRTKQAGDIVDVQVNSPTGDWAIGQGMLWEDPNLVADLSTATAATINELRQAFQIQRLLERDARGGTRYTEIVRSHFGVVSPDARLQRPEYLGGGSAPVNISPIAQNSSTDATTPQGNLAGIGTVSVQGHGFVKSFTEHVLLIGLVSVRADLSYQQGLERKFSRSTRYDFFWPALAHIGEQAILNKEIFYQGTAADDDVFGYQERYAEYRYSQSLITGQFRSEHATPLDIWHLAQEFSALPTLGNVFIQDDPPVDRVIAVPAEPHFLADFYFRLRCARPMPVFGVPGLIDHF